MKMQSDRKVNKPELAVLISLDVEEEGLFCGKYQKKDLPVNNIQYLTLLEPFLKRGVRPTLFCAYSVISNEKSLRIIQDMNQLNCVEIGAHLHHWNTPPLETQTNSDFFLNVAAKNAPLELINLKLQTLVNLITKNLNVKVQSFRMGRWDILSGHWLLLASAGILCDASVRPLHCGKPGSASPNHYLAPQFPYVIETSFGDIFEIPHTVMPLCKSAASFLPENLRFTLKHWGALALLPIQYPLWLLKLATLIYVKQGGKILSLTWHSSEMMPGGTPHLPTEKSVNRFLAKMTAYLEWLENSFSITYMTMNEARLAFMHSAKHVKASNADWA